jgi:glycosyltransferase involved in cell wall biosynthesis
MAGARVVAVIPALDEEDAIGLVVSELPPAVHEVIVVDNGSRDRTAQVARAAGARVVHEPRRGYGRACLAGIAAAPDADVFLFLDGDRSDYPGQADALLAPVLAGEAELVIGSRRLGRSAPGSHPWHAEAGTRLCVTLMNWLAGTRATDLGPFRAVRAEALRRLEMRDPSFGWTVEMQLKARRCGLRVRELPVDYRPRIGRSKVSGTLAGSFRAGLGILGTIARHTLLR